MRSVKFRIFTLTTILLLATSRGIAAAQTEVAQLQTAVNRLNAWLGEGANGDRWREYLKLDLLQEQLAQPQNADLLAINEVLSQFRSGAEGLEMSRFAAVRNQLADWRQTLAESQTENLSQLVWQLRGTHVPLDNERFHQVRDALLRHARQLEQALGPGTERSKNWKYYLRWPLLEPHFQSDVVIDRQAIRELDQVVRRFRTNFPGLEMPVFTNLARALEHYRELVYWNALAQRRDTRPIYDAFVRRLQQELERHLEEPTVETTRQIGSLIGRIHHLGHAPELVDTVRSEYGQPNIYADVSTSVLHGLAEPVVQCRPVRDCILGASIRGSALTRADAHIRTVACDNQLCLEIALTGQANSSTVGYRKPVNVYSKGITRYWATKRVFLDDDRFYSSPVSVTATTRTRPYAVKKTGGKFGRRLIEKIAWRRVYESKPQAERIAASHAERDVAKEFDQRVAEALTNGRQQYLERVRWPMVRRGLLPENLQLASSSDTIQLQATLATIYQLGTATTPPPQRPGSDVTVQLHETAINNYLTSILGGARLSQEAADAPQQLEGDIPQWLRDRPLLGELEAPEEEILTEGPLKEAVEEFIPWSLTFNDEHPVSVSFDDQQFTLRLRFAEINNRPDEDPLVNWDFLITYRIVRQENMVKLVRERPIEAFPTGFDPRWDTRLTNEQVGIRRNLERNLNRRAERGQGFPGEIPIPEVRLSEQDPNSVLDVRQLESDEGWLTLGYGLP